MSYPQDLTDDELSQQYTELANIVFGLSFAVDCAEDRQHLRELRAEMRRRGLEPCT